MSTTTRKMESLWDNVEMWCGSAHLVAFDGCHKIYLAMDQVEAEWFRENYEYFLASSPDEMFATIKKWWDESCSLRFVSAVEHNEADPNAGFTTLIGQGDDQEEDECWDCGEVESLCSCSTEDDEDDEDEDDE